MNVGDSCLGEACTQTTASSDFHSRQVCATNEVAEVLTLNIWSNYTKRKRWPMCMKNDLT